ncbi:MAG TPA: AtpZ/AtpI family protein [Gemmatimonadales bacterium]|nr:AtpZ/AtpI family protein [Gemmatimonadales bacterium]
MKPDPGSSREVGDGYRYVALGITFGLGIVLFMGVGYALDRWLGWTPWLTMVGTLVGSVLSFVNVYAKLEKERLQAKREQEGRVGK